jgi:hypothetical protein
MGVWRWYLVYCQLVTNEQNSYPHQTFGPPPPLLSIPPFFFLNRLIFLAGFGSKNKFCPAVVWITICFSSCLLSLFFLLNHIHLLSSLQKAVLLRMSDSLPASAMSSWNTNMSWTEIPFESNAETPNGTELRRPNKEWFHNFTNVT